MPETLRSKKTIAH